MALYNDDENGTAEGMWEELNQRAYQRTILTLRMARVIDKIQDKSQVERLWCRWRFVMAMKKERRVST